MWRLLQTLAVVQTSLTLLPRALVVTSLSSTSSVSIEILSSPSSLLFLTVPVLIQPSILTFNFANLCYLAYYDIQINVMKYNCIVF